MALGSTTRRVASCMRGEAILTGAGDVGGGLKSGAGSAAFRRRECYNALEQRFMELEGHGGGLAWRMRQVTVLRLSHGENKWHQRYESMELPAHFERFLRKMSVDQPKLNRVKSAHTSLRRAWEATNPKGLEQWYRQKNAEANCRFVRVFRILKRWCNQTFPSLPARHRSAGCW